MKLQQFNAGLNTRIAPHLISPAEAVESINVDFTTGVLTPIKSKTLAGIPVAEYSHYYIAQNEWVSSAAYRDYLEFKEKLYYTEVGTYPKKYDGTNEYRLGIVAPTLAPEVNDVSTQPPPVTDATLTQTAIGNIPAQEANGTQITLDYLFVNRDTNGLISETFSKSIELTGSDTNVSVDLAVTGLVNETDVYRRFNGIYRYVKTLTVLVPTATDATYDVSTNAEYETYGLTGTYQYVFTYYNSADGSESMPSPLSAEVVLAGGVCKLDAIQVSTDPQVDRRRLYRVGGTLTSFTLVAELDNVTTSYDDNTKDSEVDGRLLDSTYNNEAPNGLKYLTEAYGVFFGAVGDKVYFSRNGLPNAWPSTNFIDYEADVTGIGVTPNGIMVFTQFKTHIIIGTSTNTFVPNFVDGSQGCISHQSIQQIKGSLVWVSTDGICTSIGGPAEVVSRNKLGKLTLDIVNAKVYDDVYYIQQTDGNTLALDFRFAPAFNKYNFGTGRLITANDTLYGYLAGQLYTLQSASSVETFTYTSPLLIESEYSNRKTFKHFYVRSSGEVEVKILLDGVEVSATSLSTTDTHDLSVPQDQQDAYALQFQISGTGTVYEIEYKVMGRQNGR